ncbi:RluA family pseudouridine synthase [Streptomyces sp. 8L]|uniref:RluA family pseudouridine synthase n=1 Tax=Streptomyces sp. 8L TaxID=2877242 RepID=UPI001CD2048A|nr:RNA pseudouridine synthase [Streptomyces sp. 8L]MCA1221318.1 RNA pseudouridine synthase [Streptomyces sp. 8L]
MGTTDWDWHDLRSSSLLVEDAAILALDKPSGISVMGERHDTDIVELAQESGEKLYPVHRIDKATSGVVLFAKDLSRHGGLTRQFNKQTVDKAYLVVTETVGLPDEGTVELPLSAGRKGRIRIAAQRESIRADREKGPDGVLGGAAGNGGGNAGAGSGETDRGRWWVAEEDLLDTRRYPSTTLFRRVYEGARHSLLVVRPVTGRRHQIRVHLAWIGHPVLGDPLFDKAAAQAGSRTFLHSWRLGFDADWLGGERPALDAAPPGQFFAPLVDELTTAEARALLEGVRAP